MISCDQALELISESLDGPLSPVDRAALDEHLAGCADCRALLADFQEMERTLPTLNAPVPPDFTRSVMDRVRAEKVVDLSAVRAARRPWKQWAATAAVFAVVLLGVSTLGLDQLAVRFGSGTAAAPQSGAGLTGDMSNSDAALPQSDGKTGPASPAGGSKAAPSIEPDSDSSGGDTAVYDGGNTASDPAAPAAPQTANGASPAGEETGGGSQPYAGSGGGSTTVATPVPAPSEAPETAQQTRDNPTTPAPAGIEPAGVPYAGNSLILTEEQARQAVFDALGGYGAYPDAALEDGVLTADANGALVLENTGLSDNRAYYTFRLDRTFSDSKRTETVNFYAVPLSGGAVLTCRNEALLEGLSPEDAGWEEAKAAYNQAVQDYFDTIHN